MKVMSRAWEIAREGYNLFGGKVRDYLSESLRIAWKEKKEMEKAFTAANLIDRINELEGMGFKRWTKNGMDRMYINADILGLECDHYKSGRISDATFGGQHVSNAEALRIMGAKTYIDLNAKVLVSSHYGCFAAALNLLGIVPSTKEGIDQRYAFA